jgi:hypothetical protein
MVPIIHHTSTRGSMKDKIKRDKEVVLDYIVNRESPQKISRCRRLSLGTVYLILKQHNIKLRKQKVGRKPRNISRYDLWNEDILRFLYQDMDLSASELAWYYQVSKRHMERILQSRKITKKRDDDPISTD